MYNNMIGKVTTVYNEEITIELKETNCLSFNYLGNTYFFKGIDDYLVIAVDAFTRALYTVIAVFQKEKAITKNEDSKFTDITIIEAIPIGEWTKNVFSFGITKFPMVGKNVTLAVE